jgi:DNA-binding NarL/FixJ family response regulator
MHILVIDDFVMVEIALAQVLKNTPHTLVGVRDPRNLPEVLGRGIRFDLALVDINFGPGCPARSARHPVSAPPGLAERSKVAKFPLSNLPGPLTS